MKHKFKIGDVVVSIAPNHIGKVFTIKGLKGKFSDYCSIERILKLGFIDCPVYDIGDDFSYGEEIALELYSDGNIKSSWDECSWNPKQLLGVK